MKKKIVAIMLLMVVGCTTVGCGVKSESETGRTKIYNFTLLDGDTMRQIYDWVDPDTGVHYLIVDDYRGDGLCPRYNADGTLMIDDK